MIDDEGGPRVLPITFAVAGSALVSAIDDKPKRAPVERLARLRWLRSRPLAALTVDHYEEDWSRLAWVQAIGAVSILDAADAPDALAALAARYAPYRERPPGGPVIALEPDRVLWWRA